MPKSGKHSTVRFNILEICRLYPQVLENYNDLAFHYWVLYDNVSVLSDIRKATPYESIRRNFQKLAEMGAIQVPRRTKLARAEMEREYRQEFSALT